MKYKLLKEYPGIKVGTIGEPQPFNGHLIKFNEEVTLPESFCKEYPEWFEPVIERWVGVSGEKYCFVYAAGDVGVSDCGEHKTYFNHGNYFRTKEQAEEASKRIKKCLMDYHAELGE